MLKHDIEKKKPYGTSCKRALCHGRYSQPYTTMKASNRRWGLLSVDLPVCLSIHPFLFLLIFDVSHVGIEC